MHTFPKLTLLIAFLFVISFKCTFGQLSVIPHPAVATVKEGFFTVDAKTTLATWQSEVVPLLEETVVKWEKFLGYRLKIESGKTGQNDVGIVVSLNENHDSVFGKEGYKLIINPKSVELTASTAAGLRYGLETVGQLLEADPDHKLPCAEIEDYPRFAYRGMHLDVSRHFQPVAFLYKVIDFLVMHKMNTFHWHLVDDQGWRLEIKKYPKLTTVGAWRDPMTDIPWDDRPFTTDFSKATYGGFYTQDEVKKLVAYAAERNVTVIPEIEMPAHVMSALAAYPEYSCNGLNLGIPSGGVWPITQIYCAGKEETFQFLEDVLTEVMEIFPSTYIHIGGDEADKANWKTCPLCQERIKNEGLKNEEELQSYFIHRVERFLNSRGRRIIGWDEILEGGLAPNATVMSWRGEQGGIEAARMGHQVVMTPGSHCYFDHYQGDPAIEPKAFGGNTTLKKVYSYEPIPAELTAEEGKLVLGAQANLWTEHISDPDHAEYMIFPRLSALSEVLWSPKETRDWGDFSQRMEYQYQRYENREWNYALSAFQVKASQKVEPSKRQLLVELSSESFEPEIRFTLNGSEPDSKSTLYLEPVPISQTTTVKAAVFKKGHSRQQVLTAFYDIHKAFAASVQLLNPASERYNGGGDFGLVDGVTGTINFTDGQWKGFSGADMIAVVDLGESTHVNSVELYALRAENSWIFLPQWVSVEGSTDGINWDLAETIQNTANTNETGRNIRVFATSKSAAGIRYLRVTAKNYGVCPPGHSGAGQPAWLFVSEIVVK